MQFAVKDETVYVLEVNPRSSRTVPFVSKAKNLPLAKIASRVMAGENLSKFNLKSKTKKMNHQRTKQHTENKTDKKYQKTKKP